MDLSVWNASDLQVSTSHESLDLSTESINTSPFSLAPTHFPALSLSSLTAKDVLTAVALFSITLITIVGNLIVLMAFCVEKKLRTHFGCYVANLAATDFMVAVCAMLFYSFDMVLGYWPFGEFMCGVWIFFDYGMTFASVFTLVVISLDRYWAAVHSLHYRKHNSRRKVAASIVCICDRLQWSEPGFCMWEPSKNVEFVYFIAVVGHHTPCALLLYCYVCVAVKMHHQRTVMRTRLRGAVGPTTAGHSEQPSVSVLSTTASTAAALPAHGDGGGGAGGGAGGGSAAGGGKVGPGGGGEKDQEKEATKAAASSNRKEFAVFVTLSYIIFSYLLCWVPFHVVFDLSAADPGLVPETVFLVTFWMSYANSTLNPFLYAYSSSEFRTAFIKVIKCGWCCRK